MHRFARRAHWLVRLACLAGVVAAAGALALFGDPLGEDRAAPAAAGDGSAIVYTRAAGNWPFDVYTSDPDGRNEVQLTADEEYEVDPRWSPDGGTIAFHSPVTNLPVRILLVPRAGGSATPLITDDGIGPTAGYPSWHPDGRCLAYSGDHPSRDGRTDLKIWCPDAGRRALLVTDDRDEARSDWAPDGRSVAVESSPIEGRTDDHTYWDIYRIGIDGSPYEVLAGGEYSSECEPRWSPDGDHLAFFSLRLTGCLGDGTLRILDVKSGAITDVVSGAVGPAAWSPDGQSLIFSVIKATGPVAAAGFAPPPTAEPPALQQKGLYRVDLDTHAIVRLAGVAGGAQSRGSYEWGFGPDWWGPPPTPTPTATLTASPTASATATATPTRPPRAFLPLALRIFPLLTATSTLTATTTAEPSPAATGTGSAAPPTASATMVAP